MRTGSLLSLALICALAVGCSKEEDWGPECTALEACCNGNSACLKIANDDPEAACKTARPTYCGADLGVMEAGVTEGGASEASTPSCTKKQAEQCGTPGNCCVEGLYCYYINNPDEKQCCIQLGKACTAGEDCCQTRGGIANKCEDGKCCTFEGESCSSATDCCPSAPNCTDGKCAK